MQIPFFGFFFRDVFVCGWVDRDSGSFCLGDKAFATFPCHTTFVDCFRGHSSEMYPCASPRRIGFDCDGLFAQQQRQRAGAKDASFTRLGHRKTATALSFALACGAVL